MKFIELFIRCYVVLWLTVCLTGCGVLDSLLGKAPETIIEEIDVNKDGVVSKEEVKASPYDLDKDGILSAAEMKAAMAPNESTDGVLAILSLFNVPFAGAAAYGLKQARKNKEHITGMIVAGEKIKDTFGSNEDTRNKIKAIYSDAKYAYSKHGDHLTAIYKDIKDKHKSGKLKKINVNYKAKE